MTADTASLQERLWEAVAEVRDQHPRVFNDAPTDDVIAAIFPIIAAEVQAAKAEALREAADGIDLGEIAEEWSQGPGNRDDMHWAAGNAASSVVITLHDRATEYKTGERA